MEHRTSAYSRRRMARLALFAAFVAAFAPSPAAAIDSCKVRIDKKTGVVSMSATGLSGLIAWRDSASDDYQTFHLPGCTVDGANVSGCPLYDPATTTARIPPPSCEVCIGDASGIDCCARLKNCTPGARDCQIVTQQVPVAASSAEALTVSCPAGYKATGGGGELGVFFGFYPLGRSLSSDDAASWTCYAANSEPISGTLRCRVSCCRLP
jgi:hypothetical protein